MKKEYVVTRKDLLYPEMSFIINGVLFDVFNQIGGGHNEKYYQKAVAIGLQNKGLDFVEQYYTPLKFDSEIVGKYYLDFLIGDKIILELKRGRYTPLNVISQTKKYLSALDFRLGIIGCFTNDCVIIKRIINQN
ncbi:MAG: GxxExxY protein [bacterium]|nr:GxxExxY protein [bacterium]